MRAVELTDEAPVGATISTGIAAGSPIRVPASRYTSASFAALEAEKLWPRVWQVACSVDHVASPGDYYEYRVGWLSVLIVRGSDGVLRAFQNVCRHRGNTLCSGAGSDLGEIRCGYHRWCWDLAGSLREVPSRRGFGTLAPSAYGLLPVQVATWGPLVFVTLDLDAPPLPDFLEGVPDDIAWAALEEFHCSYLVSIPVPCNWKTLIDGFSETYHVQGIHREMLPSVDDVNGPQRLWERHGKLTQPYGIPSPRFRERPGDQAVWESFITVMGSRIGVAMDGTFPPVPDVPVGGTLRGVLAGMVRATGVLAGVDLARFDDDQIMTMQQYNLFPNMTAVVFADLLSVVRARPGPSPDEAIMDSFVFGRGAGGRRPMDILVPAGGEIPLGLVLSQDVGALQGIQRGLHQPGFTHLSLSREECRIVNLHRNLEHVLGISPSEIDGG